jgi:hypothetical protein
MEITDRINPSKWFFRNRLIYKWFPHLARLRQAGFQGFLSFPLAKEAVVVTD